MKTGEKERKERCIKKINRIKGKKKVKKEEEN